MKDTQAERGVLMDVSGYKKQAQDRSTASTKPWRLAGTRAARPGPAEGTAGGPSKAKRMKRRLRHTLERKRRQQGKQLALMLGMAVGCVVLFAVFIMAFEDIDGVKDEAAKRAQVWKSIINDTANSIEGETQKVAWARTELEEARRFNNDLRETVAQFEGQVKAQATRDYVPAGLLREGAKLWSSSVPVQYGAPLDTSVLDKPLVSGAASCFLSECGCPPNYLQKWCDDQNSREHSIWCHGSSDNCGKCGGGAGHWCDKDGPAAPDTTPAVAGYALPGTKKEPTLKRHDGQTFVVESDGREFMCTLRLLPDGKYEAEYTYFDAWGTTELRHLRFRKKKR